MLRRAIRLRKSALTRRRPSSDQVNSFSKYAGFTGVRLGWTIVPKELTFADGSSVKADYNRVMSTCFNGASNIVQRGAMSCLDKEGLAEIKKLIDYYMENGAPRATFGIRPCESAAQFGGAIRRNSAAQSSDGAPTPHHLTLIASAAAMLKSTMEGLGYTTHGGTDAPYVFVDLEGKSSWDTFSELLESSQVVTIPGAGFGPGGEGFLRLSAFAPRAACEEACERLKKAFAGKK